MCAVTAEDHVARCPVVLYLCHLTQLLPDVIRAATPARSVRGQRATWHAHNADTSSTTPGMHTCGHVVDDNQRCHCHSICPDEEQRIY
eukprot:207871-Prorocentrum_minimum.AAC.3